MSTWRLRLAGTGEPRPIQVDGEDSTSRAGFVRSLASIGYPTNYVYVDGERWTTADHDTSVGASLLRNGSMISESGESTGLESAGTHLVAVAGPASGASVRLDYHEPITVGRDPGPHGLAVADDLLSSRHFSAELGEGDVVRVRDLDSKNGSLYENEPLTESTLEEGRIVHAGASLFTVVTVTTDERATLRGETATGLNIHRQLRAALTELDSAPEPPDPPRSSDDTGGSAWWRALMPLVTSVGFAVMFGRWQFLLIAAFSPIIYAVDNRRRKKQRSEKVARDQADYEEATVAFERRMSVHLDTETLRRRAASRGGGVGSLLARFRHRSVWERRPEHPDFLTVTLGYADLALAKRTRSSERSPTRRSLWKAPLSIGLGAEGPIGITGPIDRASAVARSLLIELAFCHAPVDVALWVFTEESRADEWSFVQWLPHAFLDDGARLAATASGRGAMLRALRSLLDARRQHDARDQLLPAHVVVVDGVDSLPPADLTGLLRDGPAVGIFVIVTDPSVVPEGVRGEVRLGRFDDACSFSSEVTPQVDAVSVSQLSSELANEAALALSPLEAFRQSTESRPVGSVYFTEMIGFGDRSAEEQAELWKQHSPRTSVPVGITLDHQPVELDVVRHGPHGLVGGMTRSGKTEFLKTLFASLAIHNHPDDLAIAIIDFKAGVDHRQTARLPHVIALATNQNIDRFARTVTMLTAEIERRQQLFDAPGVSTIEGYRTAREQQPALPPIPRLLIVVDEFVELLETAEGKAEIGRLESISRVGAAFGVHLLLVTQKFTSSLPPQIDGQAGLRICFKVGNAADSKTVIGSGAAADISASSPGRAVAQLSHGDLVEFQSARIGNKSRDVVVDDGRLSAHFVTLDGLTTPRVAATLREVPDVDQDLHRVVEVARAAAALDRRTDATVPWPAELPDEIQLDALLDRGFDPELLVGIGDDPAHQRLTPVTIDMSDAVTALAGSGDSGHHEALLSMATSLALTTSPADTHIYGIDLVGQGLGLLAPLPHLGTVATRDDATALRILGWLSTEAAARRAIIARSGASDYASYRQVGGADLPRIVVFILGADRMFLHGEGTSSPMLAPMTTVVNEIAGTGIHVVFSGSHPMLQNRLGVTASRRLVFRANDPGEYPATIDRALRGQLDRPMRCVDSATDRLSQLAVVAPGDVNRGDLFRAIGDGLRQRWDAVPAESAPRRFTTAPWPLQLSDITSGHLEPGLLGPGSPPADAAASLAIGVQPESGDLLWFDPSEDGRALRIIGGPKSGRSTALAGMALFADQLGWRVMVATGSRRSPLATDPRFAAWTVEVDDIADGIASVDGPTLLVIDDAHRLEDTIDWKQLGSGDHGQLMIAIAGSTETLTRTTGIMRSLNAPNGIVLMPTRARDANGVGVGAVDDDWVVTPLAGVGIAGIAGEAHRVQFPLVFAP